ncbi:hypothetical protein MTR67_003545 [Solanum verrucosum]|uniref:Uncharacterized protein n=1 Tax=Solanum verrucosum TaxID=315347 RepID=A0AAF0PUI2_SOLVR|nr:hypothetical protein MTR67_003545 [Solanum verrucosum]
MVMKLHYYWDLVLLDKNMSYEEELVAILDREVYKLRSKDIAYVKVQWKNRLVEESTWKTEDYMYRRYPHIFCRFRYPFLPSPSLRTNDG